MELYIIGLNQIKTARAIGIIKKIIDYKKSKLIIFDTFKQHKSIIKKDGKVTKFFDYDAKSISQESINELNRYINKSLSHPADIKLIHCPLLSIFLPFWLKKSKNPFIINLIEDPINSAISINGLNSDISEGLYGWEMHTMLTWINSFQFEKKISNIFTSHVNGGESYKQEIEFVIEAILSKKNNINSKKWNKKALDFIFSENHKELSEFQERLWFALVNDDLSSISDKIYKRMSGNYAENSDFADKCTNNHYSKKYNEKNIQILFKNNQILAESLDYAQNHIKSITNSATWRIGRTILNYYDALIRRPRPKPYNYVDPQQLLVANPTTPHYPEENRDIQPNEYCIESIDRFQVKGHIDSFQKHPTIGIFIHANKENIANLYKTIESLKNQEYKNYNIIIFLEKKVYEKNKLITSIYTRNKQISFLCYNEQEKTLKDHLETMILINKDFNCFCLINSGDILKEYALYFFLHKLQKKEIDLVYCDHKRYCTSTNDTKSIHLKPDCSPETLLSYDYIGNLSVINANALRGTTIPDFCHSFEMIRYYLCLSLVIGNNTKKISHIRNILFEDATDSANKLAQSDRYKCVKKILEVKKINAIPKVDQNGMIKIEYPLPKTEPLVSIIVPSTCTNKMISMCEKVLEETNYQNFEYLLIGNNFDISKKNKTLERFLQRPKVKFFYYKGAFNYSAICNYGVKHSKGSIICLLNDDIIPYHKNWLREMVALANRKDVGIVGSKLLYRNKTVQHAGVILGINGVAAHAFVGIDENEPGYNNRAISTQNISAVTGACLLVKKDIYNKVGGLDEILAVSFNDIDFCMKVTSAGYSVLWTPYAKLFHLESISRGSDDKPANRNRFKKEIKYMQLKWLGALLDDQFYNPNFLKTSPSFQIATVLEYKNIPYIEDGIDDILVYIDGPSLQPTDNPFQVVGWIASKRKVLDLIVKNNKGFKCEYVFRSDILTTYPNHNFSFGFKLKVIKKAIVDGTISIIVQTEHKRFEGNFNFEGPGFCYEE